MANRTAFKPEPKPANLSITEIKAAIPKLERRLAEIRAFNPEEAARDSSIATVLADKVDHTLMEIFGPDTADYNRHKHFSLYMGGAIVMSGWGEEPSFHEQVQPYVDGKQGAIRKIESILDIFREKLEDAQGTPGTSAPLSLDGLDLHPALQAACGKLYKDGHYASAIENACKVLNGQVQARTGIYDQDNTKLMEFVFSPKNPTLAFNDLQDPSDQDEQQGLMFIYKGMFLAFRNPRAHKLVHDDPQTASGIIRTVDFLLKMLEKTKKS